MTQTALPYNPTSHYGYATGTTCICDGCHGIFQHNGFEKCFALEIEADRWLCIHCRNKITITGVEI